MESWSIREMRKLSEPRGNGVVMQSAGSFVTFDPFLLCTVERRCLHRQPRWWGVVAVTCIGGVDAEALVPESTQQDEAVVSCDDKTLSVYLDALI